jgi:hypothetical protein
MTSRNLARRLERLEADILPVEEELLFSKSRASRRTGKS